MIVDAHVHLSGKVHPGDASAGTADLLAAMDGAGVGAALVMSLSPDDNSMVLAAGREHPDRLHCFLVLEMDSQNQRQMDQVVAAERVSGLGEIYPNCGPAQLPERYMAPTLAMAREHGLPVLLHTGEFSYTAPIIMEGMIARNPEIVFILGHLGSLAFVSDAIALSCRYRNVYLETSGMPCSGMLRRAVAECGPDRLLFGSDYPYWDPEVERARIEMAGLGNRATRLILGENAERLFDL